MVLKCLLFLGFMASICVSQLPDEDSVGIMRFMWMTPIETYPLYPPKHTQLTKMKDECISVYNRFLKDDLTQKKQQNVQSESKSTSDAFYSDQQKHYLAYKECILFSRPKKCEHYLPSSLQTLQPIILAQIERYLQEAMVKEEDLNNLGFRSAQQAAHGLSSTTVQLSPEEKAARLFMWIGIHDNASYHAIHHHENSVVSGVMYISLPPATSQPPNKIGAITFYDPRGSAGMPPFGNKLEIQAKEGLLVLFPSWLMHSVSPTLSNGKHGLQDARISISFNYDGKWEMTSDISTGMIVE